jgi:hypothetical protein
MVTIPEKLMRDGGVVVKYSKMWAYMAARKPPRKRAP